MFLETCPFLLGHQMCWHIIVRSILLWFSVYQLLCIFFSFYLCSLSFLLDIFVYFLIMAIWTTQRCGRETVNKVIIGVKVKAFRGSIHTHFHSIIQYMIRNTTCTQPSHTIIAHYRNMHTHLTNHIHTHTHAYTHIFIPSFSIWYETHMYTNHHIPSLLTTAICTPTWQIIFTVGANRDRGDADAADIVEVRWRAAACALETPKCASNWDDCEDREDCLQKEDNGSEYWLSIKCVTLSSFSVCVCCVCVWAMMVCWCGSYCVLHVHVFRIIY